MADIFFVSNPDPQCGVNQVGKATADAQAKSQRFNFVDVECPDSTGDAVFFEAVRRHKPAGVIYNWHPQAFR